MEQTVTRTFKNRFGDTVTTEDGELSFVYLSYKERTWEHAEAFISLIRAAIDYDQDERENT
jgi:hypothetical protein